MDYKNLYHKYKKKYLSSKKFIMIKEFPKITHLHLHFNAIIWFDKFEEYLKATGEKIREKL